MEKDIRALLEMIIEMAIDYDEIFDMFQSIKNDDEKLYDIKYLHTLGIKNQWLWKLWNDCAFQDEEYFWATVRFLRIENFAITQILYNLKKENPLPFVVKELPSERFDFIISDCQLLTDFESPEWENYSWQQKRYFWYRINKSEEELALTDSENKNILTKVKKTK